MLDTRTTRARAGNVERVRPTTINDFLTITREFYRLSPIVQHVPYDEDVLLFWLIGAIGTEKSFAAIARNCAGEPVGGMVASLAWVIFSRAPLVMIHGLYVRKVPNRGMHAVRLWRSMVQWAQQHNVIDIRTDVSAGIADQSAVSFYKRMGMNDVGPALAIRSIT